MNEASAAEKTARATGAGSRASAGLAHSLPFPRVGHAQDRVFDSREIIPALLVGVADRDDRRSMGQPLRR